ncbi:MULTISPECIES: multidrug effflux MFS transporter [Rhodomicrobium]|uniref:multidrug effflux MFS transporter n=1 Tax=Rhodomicrobium TaxID=1068 RepID=UPI000B4BDD0B|nr:MULTISPECIES: multidrug effflux MFS transporter [Rhodomicrobium]
MLQTTTPPPAALASREQPFPEFVGLIALMMALTALSVDMMLPALGEIGHDLGLEAGNDRQLIITFYLAGFAAGQPFFGPLSDRFGRKGPLYLGLALFAIGSVAATLAESATAMFAARVLQGFGAAAPRILAIAIVRDRFAGRRMARVMSFVMMVFIAMPILAPSIGQAVMLAAPWRAIFAVLLLACLIILVWSWLRLAETHAAGYRLPLSPARLFEAIRAIITQRQTAGYAIAFGFIFGILLSYVASAEQIFVVVYGLGTSFPIVFGAIASAMIVASLINARLVERIGMRRVSHVSLLALATACGIVAAFGFPEAPPLIAFGLFMATVFFCFGLIGPNFNAMAMEPVGHIAGTASSFIGFYTTASGAVFGYLIGQSFDGTLRPLSIGITALVLCALVTVLITERGRLARPQHAPPPEPK